ncbi:MAG TPA: family 43 glycosylhydrolase [Kofleriaceae bacterium]|nr:family 43 glycosylhydrolase [Kofleriaceae bacterium]
MSPGDDDGLAVDASVSPSDGDDGEATDATAATPHGYIGAYKSPTIVRDGSTYHAYFAADRVAGSHRAVPHATFTADGNWHFEGDALPHLGAQAVDNEFVWAPAVAKISADRWMLYYTAHLAGTVSKMCIWRAHATSPDGPFVDDYAGPLVCPNGTQWAIDAYVVKDGHGNWNLAVRYDLPGGINTIQLRELGPQGGAFAPGSEWSELVRNSPSSWEQPVLENAGIVRLTPPNGAAHWFVFYSGGAWDDNSYAIGYADCGPSIKGPCTKKTPNGPWLATDPSRKLYGPGTPTFYTSQSGKMLMSIQAWEFSGGKANDKNAKGQIMRTYAISVGDNYKPHVTLVRVDR